MLLPLILFLFPMSIADFASDHVHRFLNQSVNPCDNFYRHVCSINMDTNDTVWTKSENFYKDLAAQLKTRTLNNPVMVDDSLKFYSTHGNKTNQNITQSMRATSRMVELLYKNSNSSKHFNDTTSAYTQMNDRLFVMEFLNNGTTDLTNVNVGIEKIHNLAKKMKEVILRRFQETSWMLIINEFGFSIFGQYMTILDELIFLTDFDNFDRNLTTLRKINRDMTSKYFESTGCAWFDVVHSFNTTSIELDKKYTSHEDILNYIRAVYSLQYNAFNYVDASMVVFLAPVFYPLNENSSESTMYGFSYIVGHEIFHSFITEALQNRSEEYKKETECIIQHYNQSCTLFAEGECISGSKTLSEDGPDVEGARAAYELLKKQFTPDELKEMEYPDLQITREQNFFYSIGMRWCRDLAKQEFKGPHSPDNIRVNSLVSQMPDFSRVFSCQPDDLLYSEPDGVCYLFGKNATGGKRISSVEEKKKATTSTPDVKNVDEAFIMLRN